MKIYLKVQVRSSRNEIKKISSKEYKVWTTASPVNNQANKKIIQLLADFLNVSKSQVEITNGKKTKSKIVDIKQV